MWDEKKNRENLRKHGIDFRDVTDLFDHPMAYERDQYNKRGYPYNASAPYMSWFLATIPR